MALIFKRGGVVLDAALAFESDVEELGAPLHLVLVRVRLVLPQSTGIVTMIPCPTVSAVCSSKPTLLTQLDPHDLRPLVAKFIAP
jgi:hypothetical protein